jgi:mxaA protein
MWRLLPIFLLLAAGPAPAAEIDLTVRPERTFGYFVGDLIRAEVEVLAPEGRELSSASLPHPGPLGVSLALREVAVREARRSDRRALLIDLVYQNFYVALDVRNIEIPGFDLRIGGEPVTVPAWTVSVAPLREIVPGPVESARDYLRPDGAPILADESAPRFFTLAAAALATVSLAFVARDRGWPPFHRRRARVFNILARKLTKRAWVGANAEAFRQALKNLHRAIDATNGASLLAEELPAFLARHPQFAAQRSDLERFYETSRRTFFGDAAEAPGPDDFRRLTQLATALARLERAA